MKSINIKRACLILFFLAISNSTESFAQKQEEVISFFEKRVAIFENFFSSKPKWLRKEASQSSPTGYIHYYIVYDNIKISYDVRKTDSLISPYMGYITVKCKMTPSIKCRDATIESARKNRENEGCYDHMLPLFEPELKFIFAYQKNDWIFKEVLANNTHTYQFSPLFGEKKVSNYMLRIMTFGKS
jgi:hypothetical protein